MLLQQCAVGTLPNYEVTELALKDLKANNFLMEQVSVVGLDIYSHPEVTGANRSNQLINTNDFNSHDHKLVDTAKDGAIAGAAVGGFAGLLVGLGGLIIPGVGPVMLAGATATAIATMFSGGAIGTLAGGLAGSLVGLGIPEDRAQIYSDRIAQGEYLIMVQGSSTEITLAKSILKKHHINDWYVYELTDASVVTSSVTPETTTPTVTSIGAPTTHPLIRT